MWIMTRVWFNIQTVSVLPFLQVVRSLRLSQSVPPDPEQHREQELVKHTHTHMLGFHVLWGLSIDVMVFILYKLYILSPYTAPIPKPNHHRRHSAILHFQKTSLSLIYKLVSSWGPKNVPTRTRILDIAILVGTFCPHNVGFT